MPFTAKPEDLGGTRLYALSGQLDSRSSPDLEKELLQAIADGQRSLLLDCRELEYISSAGLRVLVMTGKRLAAAGGRLAICGLQPSVQEVLDVAGFTHLFPIRRTRDEALEWLTVSTRAAGITHLAGSLLAKGDAGKPERQTFCAQRERGEIVARGGDPGRWQEAKRRRKRLARVAARSSRAKNEVEG